MNDRGGQEQNLGLNHERLPIVEVDQGNGERASVDTNLFVNLFSDLENYNRRNSSMATFGRALVETINVSRVPKVPENIDDVGDEDFDPGEQMSKAIKKDMTERDVSGIGLSVSYGVLLNNTGLSLEPVSGKKMTLFYNDGEIGNGQMRINVANGQKFVSFLGELKPEIVPDSGLDKALEATSKILIDQLCDQYNLYRVENESLEFFGSMGLMIDQYKRLGLSDAANNLEIYFKHLKKGDLREYIVIENKGLFGSPDGENFGPAHWQRDITPDRLKEKWNEALNILAGVKKNPKAVELYEQLKVHLLKCASFSKEETLGLKYLSIEVQMRFLDIVSQVESELEKD